MITPRAPRTTGKSLRKTVFSESSPDALAMRRTRDPTVRVALSVRKSRHANRHCHTVRRLLPLRLSLCCALSLNLRYSSALRRRPYPTPPLITPGTKTGGRSEPRDKFDDFERLPKELHRGPVQFNFRPVAVAKPPQQLVRNWGKSSHRWETTVLMPQSSCRSRRYATTLPAYAMK